MKKTAIKTDINDLSAWYQEVVSAADLAEHSPVRGCMVIRPWGYAIWERMQAVLDKEFKRRSVENIYCPLFIPLSFFEKEAKHVDGFAKECAVVTHHRLAVDSDGKLGPSPDAKLTEPLVVRPTSEAIMGYMFAKWIESYRDLPLCINQWANVVRWEMRTRLFLRTSEFLWQEGHTAHADQESARAMAYDMIVCYKNFLEQYLSISVILGEKCASERFAGADITWTVEALMPDAKALQSGTSHFLAQNFSKAFDINFVNHLGKIEHVWTTSWGVTTRLIGSMIMSHGDQNGLRVPPRISPYHIVILPIIKDDDSKEDIDSYLTKVTNMLDGISIWSDSLRYFVDRKNLSQGDKKWSWIKKGCPIILEIGMRDIVNNLCVITSRYDLTKNSYSLDELPMVLLNILEKTHNSLLSESKKSLINQIKVIYALSDLDLANNTRAYLVPWDDSVELFLQDSSWSIRCLVNSDNVILKELGVKNLYVTWALVARSY